MTAPLRYAAVLLREARWPLALFVLVPGLYTAAVCPSYAQTYATPQALARATALARDNLALTLLYGRLEGSGTIPQIAEWETGALTTLVLAVVEMLLTTRLTRGAEDRGTVELVRSCGLSPWATVAVPAGVLLAASGGVGVAAGLGLRGLEGVSMGDAAAYGMSLAVTTAICACAAVLVAQVMPTAAQARGASMSLLALWFLLRAVSDATPATGLRWLSPFALGTAVRCGGNAVGGEVLVGFGTVGVFLLAAGAAATHRDLTAGLWRGPRPRSRHLRVRSILGLEVRLALPALVPWVSGMGVLGAAFTAMGHGAVETARSGGLQGGVLGSQLAGLDPGRAFLRYLGIVAALLVAAYVVAAICRCGGEESSGILEQVISTGNVVRQALFSRAATALVSALVLLAVTTAGAAALAQSALGGTPSDALKEILGQWPAVVALAGVAVLLVGLAPRLVALAWVGVAAAGAIALVGPVLQLPSWVLEHGSLAQASRAGSAVLAGVGALLISFGVYAVRHRDLST
jgi:ABC-2 type transport system permease protein